MTVPTFDKMLRPILALASDREITRRTAADAMSDHFALTAEDRSSRIPSGKATLIHNRVGWAMTFLTKAALLAKIAPKTYRGSESGRQFLRAHPETITVKDLKAIDGWEEAWKPAETAPREKRDEDGEQSTATPAEELDLALRAVHTDLRTGLMDAVLAQSPAFFEVLVLDVLLAMGYGGSREDAAEHLGRSNDEGIDGRINQDPLGLDQIMVQAKRFARDRVVDRKEIQAFIGSLAGQGVTKGVFITTSRFAESAKEFVLRGSNTRVVLIDGEQLLDLMMRHHIGVRVDRAVEVLALDQNYFEDSD